MTDVLIPLCRSLPLHIYLIYFLCLSEVKTRSWTHLTGSVYQDEFFWRHVNPKTTESCGVKSYLGLTKLIFFSFIISCLQAFCVLWVHLRFWFNTKLSEIKIKTRLTNAGNHLCPIKLHPAWVYKSNSSLSCLITLTVLSAARALFSVVTSQKCRQSKSRTLAALDFCTVSLPLEQ